MATDDEVGHLDSLHSDNTSEFGMENIYRESSLDELPPDEQYPEGPSEEREVDALPKMDPVPLPVDRGVEIEDPDDYDTSSLSCPSRPPSVWGPFDPYNSLEDQDKEYVGFAALPNQIQWKSMKTRFEFTLMVVVQLCTNMPHIYRASAIADLRMRMLTKRKERSYLKEIKHTIGESGLGKSTLINSLFLTDLYKDRTLYNAWQRMYQTVAITKKTVDFVEKGVKLRLNIVDTPGFGDAIDDKNSWKAVVSYIDQQFEQFHKAELSLNRKNVQDNRVHCCLYFISPYGHGLKPIDVMVMKALHEKVNIVPVVAKADCFTPSEIQNIKARILNELEDYRIKVYQIPECDQHEDELFKKQYLELKMHMPFAVIGSDTIVEGKGKKFRARVYPWGVVEVENPAHCDFIHLRNMLVSTYMHHLKDITQDTLYENYRMRLLCQKH